jgi:coniferyl-aldehyde dehydrogenase
MGAIHGRAGFDTFSKQLPVFRQARMPASDWIRPPYRGVVDRAIRFLAK